MATGPLGGAVWTNCRLNLAASKEDQHDDFPPGIVARLYHSPNSHPAVRQSMHSLTPKKISLSALAVQNLVNRRGPDGLVGVIPGETKHSAKLLDLCQACYDAGEVLVCSIPLADVVLVPRIPSAAARDSLYFIAYATNVKAVELCERLRSDRQVAVVLDIDNTLVDAAAVSIAPQDWDLLDWKVAEMSSSTGRKIPGQYAFLPGSEDDPHSEGSWIIHWRFGRLNCTFRVRVRPGWRRFRTFLAMERSRYMTFVCSKGKLEYVQLIWHFLDPDNQLFPKEDWDTRINSTFPDTLSRAAYKTTLTALGCAAITQPQEPTQLAAPVCLIDDSGDAYLPEYEDSVLYVEEYRPSDLFHSDQGSVMRQVTSRLEAFWQATCTRNGPFAWQAAQSFATAILGAMQRVPMESPDALMYLQGRCAQQGELLWHQITVKSVFGEQTYVADEDSSHSSPTHLSSPKSLTTLMPDSTSLLKTFFPTAAAPPQGSRFSLVDSASSSGTGLSQLARTGSVLSPMSIGGGGGGSGKVDVMDEDEKGRETSAEEAVMAALMMRC